ncbi:hypothetical protein F0562_033239 [Nyssa sinensis]|uniref:Paramyosin n=1 Tax=Nyssa sinensis TaxID=561372 RepID=A0A5J5ASH5_9ASTE|nr:hypothetical protein F0562_033239 [Nyssa sinensis]
MASAGDEDNDAVLSDVEDDDQVPVVIKHSLPEDVSVERFREVLAELDREKQAREAAENSKSDLQVSFNRLKVLAHEAIKKRDECTRQRDEALREKEEALKSNEKLSADLAEAVRVKDEVLKQRDDLTRQFDEAVKAKDTSRSEIETAAQMLVTGIDKISGKVSNFKNFTAGGLPRSQKYTGLPAIAYGVIKRTNQIVEELLRQIDSTAKSRNEAREQMEQRNYEIAIEISQLEATISGLREEVSKKTSVLENLEKSMAEKDGKMSEMERELGDKLNLAENEVSMLTQLVSEYDDKLRNLELKMESQSFYRLKQGAPGTEEDEISTLAGALENIIKQSQLEIIELQHSVEELRAETSLLKEHVEAQAKELSHRKQRVEELEEKERVANENVEGLMMDIATAEEEITRWKVAAQQEAAAGKAVEQEFLAQLTALQQELEEAKQGVIESEKKAKIQRRNSSCCHGSKRCR